MRTILLLCLLLILKQATAQNKTFTGFYVNPAGDTVRGSFPKYNQSSKNPVKIPFTPNGSSTLMELNPLNCLSVSITNYDEYLSYSGNRLVNPTDDILAMENQAYFTSRDSVANLQTFLRLVLQTPRCSIYEVNDNVRINFFYQLPGQPLQELRLKKYVEENRVRELAEYRQQLNTVFGEEIERKHMARALEDLAYSEDALSHFIRKLFSVPKSKDTASDFLSGWILGAGVSANSFKVTGDLSASEAAINYKTSYAPYVLIGYYVPIQRNFNRYFFYPQLRLFNYKNSGEKPTYSFEQRITYQCDLAILPQLNIGANIVNQASFRFFIYGGVGMTTFINNRKVDEYFNPSNNTLYSSHEYKLASLVVGLNLSSGVTINNKFQILASYNFSPDIDDLAATNSKPSNLQVGVGYKFGKH
jgi:hypothetical protein